MGTLLSRLRPRPYYKACEKFLERLDKKRDSLVDNQKKRQALLQKISQYTFVVLLLTVAAVGLFTQWVHNLPAGTLTTYDAAKRTSIALFVLLISALLHTFTRKINSLLDRWDAKRLKKMEKERASLLGDLKDSAHYNKILDLLMKYDPEERRKATLLDLARKHGYQRRHSMDQSIPASVPPHHRIVASTGRMLMPVLDKLANNLVGDDPVLIKELGALQAKLDEVQVEKAKLDRQNALLQAEVEQLRASVPASCATEEGVN